jgi:mannose-6-phosphate isomerase-like protein (cupin superfamily)
MLASLKFPFEFDVARLQSDLALIQPDEWQRHFNTSIYEGDWSGVALRAVPNSRVSIYPDPMATDNFADTEVLTRCTYFREVLAAFQCPLTSARLLRLKARSNIREHRDYKLGFEDGEVRVHVPIVTEPAVVFTVAGQRVPMLPGECWYVNVNEPHRVDNESDIDRVHLVIDAVVNDWLGAFFPAEDVAALAAKRQVGVV